MPAGRPTNYTTELAEKVCQHLANGVPMATIAKMDDMPGYSTLLRWQVENAAFRELSTRAKQDGTHHIADEAMEIADNMDIDPQHKRIMIDTRLRLIGKWNSRAYGDKVEQTIQGPAGDDGKPTAILMTIVDPKA